MVEKNAWTILTERSTTREPLTDDDVRDLLRRVDRVVIARGRSRRDLVPEETRLDDLRGPSGKFRAPILLLGETLIVGFNAELLDEVCGS